MPQENIPKRAVRWALYLPIWWFVSSLLAKTGYAQQQLERTSALELPALLGNGWFFFCIAVTSLCLPRVPGLLALWLANLGISLLFGADTLYYRGLEDLPSITQLVGAHQLPKLAGGAASSLFFSDLIFVFDLLPALLFFRAKAAPRSWSWKPAIPLLVSLLTVGIVAHQKELLQDKQLLSRVSNLRQARWGLPFYHLYDLYYATLPMRHRYEPLEERTVRERLRLSDASVSAQFPGYASQQDHNVLLVLLESFSGFVINLEIEGQEVTPFLNRLCRESVWGLAEDQTGDGGTSDGEFIVLNSLHPPSLGPLVYHFGKNRFRSLAHIFGDRGYRTIKAVPFVADFWNGRVVGQSYGFAEGIYEDDFQSDPERTRGWGLTDEAFFSQLLPILESGARPYFCMAITVMMHHPFEEIPLEEQMLDLPYTLEGTMLGRYLQLARLRDHQLEQFCQALKDKKMWNDTVFVLVGDHRTRMPRREYERTELSLPKHMRDRVFFMIHCPDGTPARQLQRGLGLIDVAPTLEHLFGFDPERTAFLGRNVLAGPKAAVTRLGAATNPTRIQYLGDSPEHSVVYDLASDDFGETPAIPALFHQTIEELRASDTLLFGDSIMKFVKDPLP